MESSSNHFKADLSFRKLALLPRSFRLVAFAGVDTGGARMTAHLWLAQNPSPEPPAMQGRTEVRDAIFWGGGGGRALV